MSRSRNRTLLRAVVVVATVIAGWAIAPPSSTASGTASREYAADDFAICVAESGFWTNCATDNTILTWCYGPSMWDRDTLQENTAWAVANLRNRTILRTDSKGNECPVAIDVMWRHEADMGNLVLGRQLCRQRVAGSPRVCASSWVSLSVPAHYDWGDFRGGGSDGTIENGEIGLNLDMSACHELGHAVGLIHHGLDWYGDNQPPDCMRSPWLEVEGANAGWRVYNRHHVEDHIDIWNY